MVKNHGFKLRNVELGLSINTSEWFFLLISSPITHLSMPACSVCYVLRFDPSNKCKAIYV